MNICQFAAFGRFVTSGDSLNSRNEGEVLRYNWVNISISRSIVQPHIPWSSGLFTCLNNWESFAHAPLRSPPPEVCQGFAKQLLRPKSKLFLKTRRRPDYPPFDWNPIKSRFSASQPIQRCRA